MQLMKTADDYAISRHMEKKPLIAAARQAVQTAEDAREIAVKRIDEVRLADATPGIERCAGKSRRLRPRMQLV